MAIYKRGYQRYQGELTGRFTRIMTLPRFAWARLFQQRLLLIVLVASIFWPLACAIFIYVSNHAELWQGMAPGLAKFLEINGNFFLVFMNAQSSFALLLAALTGPGLIAPDLANNALPLYFSRPLSRTEYVLARMMVLIGILSLVTWIPGVLLFGMQTGMAGWTWFSRNWYLGAAVFSGFALWILLLSLVALACSAYVKWRLVAGALVLGFFFVLAGAAELVNAVLRVKWAVVFNPLRSAYTIWCGLLGVDPPDGPSAITCAIALGLIGALLCLVLERKLRPVEVIS